MDSIFHEKQEGYLCAQHCLNALLQAQYYDAVSLANLAQELDREERERMAENGEDTDEYRRFIQQPSGNMDDSGYFSVQVISNALKNLELDLVPYTSSDPIAISARKNPTQEKAFICHYKSHWFTIRKIGNQWFNLNSMQNGPELLSDLYVVEFLAQLIEEGYSIFIVVGKLPSCPADEILRKNPVGKLKSLPVSQGYRLGTRDEERAKILDTAKLFSNVSIPSTSSKPDIEIIEHKRPPKERIIPIKIESDEEVTIIDDEEDRDLQKALKMSLEGHSKLRPSREPSVVSSEDDGDLRKAMKMSLEDNPQDCKGPRPRHNRGSSVVASEDEDDLRRALQMSLECVTVPQAPSQEEIRWRRLAYHNKLNT